MNRKQTKKTTREKSLRKRIAIAVIIFGISCLLTVWQRVTVEETYREIGRLEKQLQSLVDQNAELEVKLSQLSEYRRLRKIAEEKYSMVFPQRISVTVPTQYTKLFKENDPDPFD